MRKLIAAIALIAIALPASAEYEAQGSISRELENIEGAQEAQAWGDSCRDIRGVTRVLEPGVCAITLPTGYVIAGTTQMIRQVVKTGVDVVETFIQAGQCWSDSLPENQNDAANFFVGCGMNLAGGVGATLIRGGGNTARAGLYYIAKASNSFTNAMQEYFTACEETINQEAVALLPCTVPRLFVNAVGNIVFGTYIVVDGAFGTAVESSATIVAETFSIPAEFLHGDWEKLGDSVTAIGEKVVCTGVTALWSLNPGHWIMSWRNGYYMSYCTYLTIRKEQGASAAKDALFEWKVGKFGPGSTDAYFDYVEAQVESKKKTTVIGTEASGSSTAPTSIYNDNRN